MTNNGTVSDHDDDFYYEVSSDSMSECGHEHITIEDAIECAFRIKDKGGKNVCVNKGRLGFETNPMHMTPEDWERGRVKIAEMNKRKEV